MIQKAVGYFEKRAIHSKRLYILPTKTGLLFIGTTFALFLIGLAYGNNLALLLTFTLFAAFLLIMFQTHSELEKWIPGHIFFQDGAENDAALFARPRAGAPQIEMRSDKGVFSASRLPNKGSAAVYALPGIKRGKYAIKHLKLWTTGQYHFFYVWTYRPLNQEARIFPSPLKTSIPAEALLNKGFEATGEFKKRSPYYPGAQAKRIDWKAFARTDQLLVKDFQERGPGGIYIAQEAYGQEKEKALSQMAWLVNYAFRNQIPWEIKGANFAIPLNQGASHWRASMERLSEA